MRIPRQLGLGIVALSLLFPRTAHASSILFTTYTGEATTNQNGNRTIGTEFTVGSTDLTVLSLGVYDAGLDGLNNAIAVGIWLAASPNTLIVSGTVPSGSLGFVIEDWRFTSVAAGFTLTANTTYRIGAYAFDPGGNAENNPVGGTFSLGTGIASVLSGSVLNGSGFGFPDGTDSTNRVFANAEVEPVGESSPVPEPASLLLFGSGVGTLVLRRFRKRT